MTKINIKKLVKKIKVDKYINYIDVKGLLKEYHAFIKAIKTAEIKCQSYYQHFLQSNVLPQSEIDELLASISSTPKK